MRSALFVHYRDDVHLYRYELIDYEQNLPSLDGALLYPVTFSSDGRYAAQSRADTSNLSVYTVPGFTQVHTLTAYVDPEPIGNLTWEAFPSVAQFSPDGSLLVVAYVINASNVYYLGKISIIKVATWNVLWEYTTNTKGIIKHIELSANNRWLLICLDRQHLLFDIISNTSISLNPFAGFKDAFDKLDEVIAYGTFSPDNRYLVVIPSGSVEYGNNTIPFLILGTGTFNEVPFMDMVESFDMNGYGFLEQAKFSPNGEYLALIGFVTVTSKTESGYTVHYRGPFLLNTSTWRSIKVETALAHQYSLDFHSMEHRLVVGIDANEERNNPFIEYDTNTWTIINEGVRFKRLNQVVTLSELAMQGKVVEYSHGPILYELSGITYNSSRAKQSLTINSIDETNIKSEIVHTTSSEGIFTFCYQQPSQKTLLLFNTDSTKNHTILSHCLPS